MLYACFSWHGLSYYFKEKESANVIAGGSWRVLFGEETKGNLSTYKALLQRGSRLNQHSHLPPDGLVLSSLGWGRLCHHLSFPRSSAPPPHRAQVPEHLEGTIPKVPRELGKLLSLWHPGQNKLGPREDVRGSMWKRIWPGTGLALPQLLGTGSPTGAPVPRSPSAYPARCPSALPPDLPACPPSEQGRVASCQGPSPHPLRLPTGADDQLIPAHIPAVPVTGTCVELSPLGPAGQLSRAS